MRQANAGGAVKRCWVGTSWKMNKSLAEAVAFAAALRDAVDGIDANVQPFVVPPFTAMRQVKEVLAATRVRVGAQNMHWDDAGAWTGEISPAMLVGCGLDLVELGHSERREHFNDTNRTVGLKAAAAVRHGLVPLVCVGETLAERENGLAEEILVGQVAGALGFLDEPGRNASILFAYEPVWAIGGSGIPARADYAGRQQELIARTAGNLLGQVPPVLHGGSVNSGNAAELIAQPHVDGLFIGRAAWQVEGYLDILARVGSAIRA